jgi:hypothetical protein
MENKQSLVKYFWQIICAHTIAYFVVVIFALIVMNYKDLFSSEIFSSFIHPVDAPIVALGPLLQILRGIILALIFLPLRKSFFEEERRLIKLGLIVFILSFLSTIESGMDSFEGFIYTQIPYMYQIFGYPETIIYVLGIVI